MCGIVAAAAAGNVVPFLMEGLQCLEYRGYDSAGVAVANGSLHRLRSVGRVSTLAQLVSTSELFGTVGIAHTRWATHGAPSVRNAHPHASHDRIAVVHNGIIENHEALRARLVAHGYEFVSDTDSEVIVHLIHSYYVRGSNFLSAVQGAVRELSGAYAIAVICKDHSGQVVAARNGSPLLLGLADNGTFAASDASALLQATRSVVHLLDGDVAELTPDAVRIHDATGAQVQRAVRESKLLAATVELGSYRHFMQKEIFEQPAAVAATLAPINDAGEIRPALFGTSACEILSEIESITIVGCGTSYHSGLVARYWIESLAHIPVNVEIASEYRYRESPPASQSLTVAISQSGETADTLAALTHACRFGQQRTLAISNVAESSLVHQSQLSFLTHAGPEIGVASTKAFTTQLAALFLLALVLAKLRGHLSLDSERAHLNALHKLPATLADVLQTASAVAIWAKDLATKQHALFLGRGMHYPIALEGALKFKEISYVHAEGYPAGELKHGPLALVDSQMPVIAVAPNDALFEKLNSNLQEVRARGGELYVLTDSQRTIAETPGIRVIRLPHTDNLLSPLLYAVPLQLLAYHAAVMRGTDVDKPRNLAKSVTVE
jgi:glucosamine--fructose-6-phosphate aminotransferase (isomerizing)